ncbi:MAG TPA: calcium-binding protein [Microvirga sp.]|jgi:Ca2+-binding RTX toxin-like protein
MARINYQTGAGSKITFDEVVSPIPDSFQFANMNASGFMIVNLATGYRFVVTGSNLEYVNGAPSAGTVTSVWAETGAGGENSIANVDTTPGGDLDTQTSVAVTAFMSEFNTKGTRAALTLVYAGKDEVNGSSEGDRMATYGAGDVMVGRDGNDTFVIGDGVTDVTIFGMGVFDTDAVAQVDIIEVTGSASIRSLNAIDRIKFAEGGSATKVVQINPFNFSDVDGIDGSSLGVNTLLFTLANEAMDLDLSKKEFTNWGRDGQTIRIVANTNASLILDDHVVGSAFNDSIEAGQGRDVLYGGAGNDTLLGGAEADVLDGGSGNDRLEAGDSGPNILFGGLGDDSYFLGTNDTIVDTGGIDTILVVKSTTLTDKEKVFEGLAVYDVNSRNKVDLKGNKKANILDGNAGVNKLDGGKGNDVLSGWDGKDVLKGGDGKDSFVFEGPLGRSNVDRITDFRSGDSIQLDHDIFGSLAVGRIKSSMLRLDKRAKDKDDFLVYDKSKGALYYDADGSGRAFGQVQIATLENKATLGFKDFLII